MPPGKRKAPEVDWTPPPRTSITGTSSKAGSSSNSIPLDSTAAKPPPAKRQRKKKDPDATEPEKRGAIFKKSCPKNILDRVDRVMSQRFFMVDRKREGTDLHEEFNVLGSTGNVYTVVIDKRPSCNCPDALKGNHCKHILFIYLKVLQVSQVSGYWYQKALLTSELAEIFAHAPLAPNSVSNPRIRAAYNKATGKETTVVDKNANNNKKRIPGPEDDCPICYETMHKVDTKRLTFCDECGNALHNECFQQWAKTATKVTCVWCRANWVTPAIAGGSGSGSRTSEGYINLSGVPGITTSRDTSSYYQGPKRGQRYYGYQNYK